VESRESLTRISSSHSAHRNRKGWQVRDERNDLGGSDRLGFVHYSSE
jgi:hypothetical protein